MKPGCTGNLHLRTSRCGGQWCDAQCRRVWPNDVEFPSRHRGRAAASLFADPVRYDRRGRFSKEPGGILWRAKDPLPPMPKYKHTGGYLGHYYRRGRPPD